MPENILSQLTDFGALGLFAGFLLYQHFTMQRKLDSLIERFQEQLNEIRKESVQQEEKLRERYDGVIAGYRDEATKLREGLVRSVEDLVRKVDSTLQ